MARILRPSLPLSVFLSLVALPTNALAANGPTLEDALASIDTLWVLLAAILVLFMQGGFALLDIGFSRSKNAGTQVAKILTNLSIAAIVYWAVGFAFAFGSGEVIGTTGFFLSGFDDPLEAFPIMGLSNATIEAKWVFQFGFAAVSLAIVWGATLERIRYSAYVIYAVVFAAIIYPVGSHWVFGGGWLQTSVGVQDFAGSTAVHLIGATGALAALLLLGPRRGKYGPEGQPRAIPGHSMPLAGLGIIILFIGWFGFNAGSTLNALDGRFAEIAMINVLAAGGGVLGALATSRLLQRTIDIGMVANGLVAGLVSATAPSGYIEAWPAPIIGLVGGVLVVVGVRLVDRKLDDPVGALSSHGLAGIWGTLSAGIFTAPALARYNAVGDPEGGLVYSGSLTQLGDQVLGIVVVFAFVFGLSYATFAVIKATIGLRVTAEEEELGLDIVEHGMYGYPEQFIAAPEIEPARSGASVRPGLTPAPGATAGAVAAGQASA